MANILITRPRTAAHGSAERVKNLGHKPHILPLVEIVSLDFIRPTGDFDALLATSAHAFFPSQCLVDLQSLPLFCVGHRTVDAARKAGFKHIAAIAASATELVCVLDLPSPCHFLYLAGGVRRPILEQGLMVLGHQVTAVEIYHQRPLYPESSALASMPAHFDAALFYCATAAQQAIYLAPFFDESTRFLCLSSRIAEALPPDLQPHARIAYHPDEASLLSML